MLLYLTRCAELLNIVGPDTPKCVNNISPKSSYNSLFFSKSVIFIAIFLKLNPCNSLQISFSYISSGTNDGFIFVIVCPNFSTNLYPSPVEPVNG